MQPDPVPVRPEAGAGLWSPPRHPPAAFAARAPAGRGRGRPGAASTGRAAARPALRTRRPPRPKRRPAMERGPATRGARIDSSALRWWPALALAHTCIYDAWAAYDRTAVGTRLGGTLRRPARERRLRAQGRGAELRRLSSCGRPVSGSRAGLRSRLMVEHRAGPRQRLGDTPSRRESATLLRKQCSRFGTATARTSSGTSRAASPACRTPTTRATWPSNRADGHGARSIRPTVHDVNRWQPLTYVDGAGNLVTPPFAGAALAAGAPVRDGLAAGELRSRSGPARHGSREFMAQAQELIDVSARLTDEER